MNKKIAKSQKSKSDTRFELDNTQITTPWRSYARFNKYDESFPQKIYQMGVEGKTLNQIARSLKCSTITLKRWAAEIEDVGEALEMANTEFKAGIEDTLQEVMIIDPNNYDEENAPPEVNTKLYEMYVKANLPETYAQKPENIKPVEIENPQTAVSKLNELIKKAEKISISAEGKDGSVTKIEHDAGTSKLIETELEDVQDQ